MDAIYILNKHANKPLFDLNIRIVHCSPAAASTNRISQRFQISSIAERIET